MPLSLNRLHLTLVALVLSLVANGILGFTTWRTDQDRRATVDDLNTTQSANAALEREKRTLAAQSSECAVASDFSANLVGYLTDRLSELDQILLATDSAAVDFISWCSENATFYGDDLIEGNRRHAAWTAKQEQTNADYAALRADLEDFVSKLEDATDVRESTILHAL
jgi:cell division protein FtsB